MNASRQPFVVSALLTALIVAACGLRLVGTWAAFNVSELVGCVLLSVWVMAVVSQLSIKFAAGSNRNYLPIQVFAAAAVGVSMPSVEGLGCALLFALALRQSIFSIQKGYRFESLFRTGLYLGIAPLFCSPLAVASVATLMGMLIVYKRSVREWAVGWTGFLLPFGLVSFGFWALGWESFARRFWGVGFGAVHWLGEVGFEGLVVLGIATALGFCGIVVGLVHRKQMRSSPARFAWVVSVLFFGVLVSGIASGSWPEIVSVVGLAASCALPYGFWGRWGLASTALYFALLAVVFLSAVAKYNI